MTYTFKITDTLSGIAFKWFVNGEQVGGDIIPAQSDIERLNAQNDALNRCYEWVDTRPQNLRMLCQTYDYYPVKD